MMVHIVETTEEHLDYDSILVKAGDHLKSGVSSAIGYASVLAAANLNARCIITPSVSGATTRVVSNLRPRQEIWNYTERTYPSPDVDLLGRKRIEVSGIPYNR